jgi:hypothetical protein
LPLQRSSRFFDVTSLAGTPEVYVEPRETLEKTTPRGTPLARHRQSMRLLRDEHDELVLAYELTGARDTDPRMLVIERSDGRGTQRLHQYPANWRQLKDAELLSLGNELSD